MSSAMRVLVYTKDLVRIRQIQSIKIIQPGGLWSEISLDQNLVDLLSYHRIWFEYLGGTA